MRITRTMLENYVSETNGKYELSLSVEYFNGYTHIYNSGYSIYSGTTPKCYRALQIFMKGFHVGVDLTINNEVV